MQTVIRNSFGERIDYSFAQGETASRKAGCIVLFGHGVTGNKDRPVVVDAATALNAAGFDTLRFSFAGNGDSEGDFRAATISKECADLKVVIDVVADNYTRIIYVGHSMGAAVGVLLAAADPRLSALVSLAGMVNTRNFAQTEFSDQIPGSGHMWDDPDYPLSSAFMQDLCDYIGSVAPQAAAIGVPWLLLHGTADDVVLPVDTQQIADLKGDAAKAVYIEGADHSFSEPAHKKQMISALLEWL